MRKLLYNYFSMKWSEYANLDITNDLRIYRGTEKSCVTARGVNDL